MAIFGDNGIGGTLVTPGVDIKNGSRYNCPDNNADVTKVTAYLSNAHVDVHNAKAAIYSDNAGSPDALQVESAAGVALAGNTIAWYDFPLVVTLNNADYHLVVKWDNLNVGYYYDAGAYWQRKAEAYANAFSDPYGAPDATKARDMSIYATYTVGGGVVSRRLLVGVGL